MADYLVPDAELTVVADAIRTKGGTSDKLRWPDGFATAVEAIPAGGGDEKTYTVMFSDYYFPDQEIALETKDGQITVTNGGTATFVGAQLVLWNQGSSSGWIVSEGGCAEVLLVVNADCGVCGVIRIGGQDTGGHVYCPGP